MITSEFSGKALLNNAAVHQLPHKVCNMTYLHNMSRGNTVIIQNILAVFFKETAQELVYLRNAIESRDYIFISNICHKLKSAFSILGIVKLQPVFIEMEYLSSIVSPVEKIEELNKKIVIVFNQARNEMKFVI
jgi:HPt (histidine-containing phosphotransfer) domain-containing protein